MRNSGFLWIIIFVLLILDLYVFQALKLVISNLSPSVRLTINIIYWLVSIAALGTLVLLPYLSFASWNKVARMYVFALIIGLFFSKLLASIFFLVDDIRRGGMWILEKLYSNPSVPVNSSPEGITRSVFLSWLGLGLGSTLFGSLVYGFSNKYNYQVKRIRLKYENFPAAFAGLRVVHISDIHAGSFMDKKAVEEGVKQIMAMNADLVLFTGDLVNDHAHEMDPYYDVFSRVSAPLGVYSTLGNHDYGEYALPRGLNAAERKIHVNKNVEKLKKVHKRLGWKLLMNEHVVLEKDGQTIALIGIENWSKKGNFPKYGKLEQAYEGTGASDFRILLSHDPSHWEAEVREQYKDIDLMLSGHTHGMQFGVEIPGFKWSPVQYMYKQWAGLYEQEDQKLYVNRGFGFIGYPGRVGILPEITILEFI